MKRLWKPLLLAGILMTLLTVTALAADKGFTAAEATDANTTVAPQKADKSAPGEAADGIAYPDAERLAVTYGAAESGKQYLLIATNKETDAPQKDDIVYIDQVSAEGATVSFNVYPSELKSDVPCYIYLVSDGALTWTKIATYTYHRDFLLGDVDNDGDILGKDAMFVLQYAVDLETPHDALIPTAGDVDGDGDILGKDAMFILQYAVNLIDKFPAET